ncbi:MAG: thiamine pyrophosphate-dependent enzyme [Pirellulales bacterium]|nr:thiamine pyrophosphate-dependent enzyme [Pirellulales bacterium]
MPAYTNNSNSSFASKSLPPALCKLRNGQTTCHGTRFCFSGPVHHHVFNKSTCRLRHSAWVLLYPQRLVRKIVRPDLKTIALVGDGAFQMTGMELSTTIKHQLVVTIIVFDNGGYETERLIHDGMFNDINTWQYQMLPQVLGGGKGHEVRNESEFDKALSESLSNDTELSLIRVHTTVKITAPPLIASVQV